MWLDVWIILWKKLHKFEFAIEFILNKNYNFYMIKASIKTQTYWSWSYSVWIEWRQFWFVQWANLHDVMVEGHSPTIIDKVSVYSCLSPSEHFSHFRDGLLSWGAITGGLVDTSLDNRKMIGRWLDVLSPTSRIVWLSVKSTMEDEIRKWSFHFLWSRESWM